MVISEDFSFPVIDSAGNHLFSVTQREINENKELYAYLSEWQCSNLAWSGSSSDPKIASSPVELYFWKVTGARRFFKVFVLSGYSFVMHVSS